MSTQTETADITRLLEKYPPEEGQGALMGLLQDIQEQLGYLPVEALEAVINTN